MIPVEFRLEPGENVYDHLPQWAGLMPWLDYLCVNRLDMVVRHIYDPAPHQTIVVLEFELEPKKETYYRLKYGNGT